MLHFVTLLHQVDSYLELEQATGSMHSWFSTDKATQIFGSLSIAELGTAQLQLVTPIIKMEICQENFPSHKSFQMASNAEWKDIGKYEFLRLPLYIHPVCVLQPMMADQIQS